MMPARQRKPPGCEPGGWSIQLRADNRLMQKHADIVPAVPDALEYGQPMSSHETASPSIRKSLAFIAFAADAIDGKHDVQSRPLRVMIRTPAASRRTIFRKPSCLISCGQPGPLGRFFAAAAGRAQFWVPRTRVTHGTYSVDSHWEAI
jgi:hypothetical protein